MAFIDIPCDLKRSSRATIAWCSPGGSALLCGRGELIARQAGSDLSRTHAAELIPMILVIHRVSSSIQGLADSACHETIDL
jgi:hypothetical protein